MRRSSLWVARLLVAGALVACSSKKPAEAPVTGASAAPAPEPAPDLSPVAAPPDVIGVARLAQPSGFIDALIGWTGLPVDWRNLLAGETPGADRVLSLDAPVDAVVALSPTAERTPEVQVAISIGLTSYADALTLAKAQGRRLRELAPGIQKVSDEGDVACVIARAVGVAPARLVCAPEPEQLEALLPYMIRGLPRESVGSRDLHAELRLEPLRRRFGAQLRQLKSVGVPFILHALALDAPAFDRALAEAAHAVVEEVLALSEDVTQIELDLVRLDDQNFELSVALNAQSERSWIVQTLRSGAARTLAAPDSFWRLPADADFAAYGASWDPARLSGLRRTLRELVIGFLASEKVPAKTSDALANLVDMGWADDAAFSWAHGPAAAGAAGSSVHEQIAARVGWYVMAIEKDAASYRPRLDALARAVQSKELRAAVMRRFELGAELLPTMKILPAPAGLPKGSAEYQVALPEPLLQLLGKLDEQAPAPVAKPAGRATPLTFTLLLVPDASRTWLVLARDSKLARSKFEVVRTGAAEALAGRAGLEPLRALRMLSGGFLTLQGLLDSVPKARAVLGSAPARGETPMLYWTAVKASGNPAARWTIRIPRSAVRDLGAAGPALIRAAP